MIASAWALCWFARAREANQREPVLRVWDYLVSSDANGIIFLIASIFREKVPPGSELPDYLIDLSECFRNFAFTNSNCAHLINQAEDIKHEILSKSTYLREFNETLGREGERYKLPEIRPSYIWSLMRRPTSVSVLVIVVSLILVIGYHRWRHGTPVLYYPRWVMTQLRLLPSVLISRFQGSK